MSERRGELWLLALLGVGLVVASILTFQHQRNAATDQLYGSTHSSGEVGGRALYLWLDELGYPVQRLQRRSFALRAEDDVLWVLVPPIFNNITEPEAEEIADWVRDGGTLIWADSQPSEPLFEALQVPFERGSSSSCQRPVTPWLRRADVSTCNFAGFRFLPAPDTVPLLADLEGSVGALRRRMGQGEAWLFASWLPFTNAALKNEANSALVEGLLAQLPAGSTMTFDEIHHGFGGTGVQRTLLGEMRRAPWGWAVYYAMAVLAAWMLLRGRAFGRPLPLPQEHLRREAGEFARSMAWLYRRARQRAPILRHQHARLKRRVAERYRLPPTESDDAFASALHRARPDVDADALRRHLAALRHPAPTEGQLWALARATDEWLHRLDLA